MSDNLWNIVNRRVEHDKIKVLTDGDGEIYITFLDKEGNEAARITMNEDAARSLRADLDWALSNQKEK